MVLRCDQDYQPQSRVVAGVQNLTCGFDAAGRMAAANDNLDTTRSQSFGYDALSRLTSAGGLYGSIAYGYDNGGNRTSAGTASYAYASTSNQLQSVTANGNTRSFTYDGRGNLTGDARSASANWTLTYTQEGRLSQVADNGQTQAVYSYDYLGRRATKTLPGTPATVSVYSYDRKGHLLAEADGQGNVLAEYVWLEDLPVALISGGTVYAIHTDHLGTPQKITDPNQTLVWDAITTPWGEMASLTSVLTANLRLPGQYYDAESGYHQNWHRDYAPSLGRYLQPDPIGLAGGWNDYAYVGGNPVGRFDPWGLSFSASWGAAGGIIGGTIAAGGSVVADVGTGGLNIPATPAEVAAGTAGGAAIGAALGSIADDIFKMGSLPPGYWEADNGAAEWGRRNGVGAREGKGRFHGIKQACKGQAKDKFAVDPENGDVVNPDGEWVGNLGEVKSK